MMREYPIAMNKILVMNISYIRIKILRSFFILKDLFHANTIFHFVLCIILYLYLKGEKSPWQCHLSMLGGYTIYKRAINFVQ